MTRDIISMTGNESGTNISETVRSSLMSAVDADFARHVICFKTIDFPVINLTCRIAMTPYIVVHMNVNGVEI